MKQCFAALSDIVYELKESQIEGESLLRNPSVGTEPRAQERPESLDRVHVDLVMTIPIFVSGVLSGTMADGTVDIAPLGHSRIDVVLVREHSGARGDRLEHQGFDGCLFDVFEHSNDNLSGSLNHAEDRRLLLFESAPAAGGLQAVSSSFAAFFLTASGKPLCPATT